MPKVPGQESSHGDGGGAAERLRQFEQARGEQPDKRPDDVAETSSTVEGHDDKRRSRTPKKKSTNRRAARRREEEPDA